MVREWVSKWWESAFPDRHNLAAGEEKDTERETQPDPSLTWSSVLFSFLHSSASLRPGALSIFPNSVHSLVRSLVSADADSLIWLYYWGYKWRERFIQIWNSNLFIHTYWGRNQEERETIQSGRVVVISKELCFSRFAFLRSLIQSDECVQIITCVTQDKDIPRVVMCDWT